MRVQLVVTSKMSQKYIQGKDQQYMLSKWRVHTQTVPYKQRLIC